MDTTRNQRYIMWKCLSPTAVFLVWFVTGHVEWYILLSVGKHNTKGNGGKGRKLASTTANNVGVTRSVVYI